MKIEEIEELYGKNFRQNKPVVWKDYIKIYPVSFKDIEEFSYAINCLLYDPMDYEDFTLATLPRLYFLTSILEYEYLQDEEKYMNEPFRVALSMQLKLLLKMVLQDQDYVFIKSGKYWKIRVHFDSSDTDIDEDYIDINSSDFEEFRLIVLLQNAINFSDDFVHNDIKEYIENENKNNSIVVTFEDKKEIVMVDLHVCDEEMIDKMTIRRVNRICNKVLSREAYVMQETASMSGFVTFKNEPIAWYGKSETDIYDRYFKKAKQV